ncbi:O-antigen ligase family protein [Ornithinimicrobium sp. W1679]|uniref:O-antigen ligase family protein n=1 Tax=Ornithinimicrobium sp. W1679 TaxID=3418770 RepID=UPI003CF71E9C
MTVDGRDRLRIPALVILGGAATALAILVGYAIPEMPLLVVGGVVFLLLVVLALTQPVLLPLLAMPLIVVVLRVDAGPVDMTLSDWVLALAFWPAVLFAPRPFSPELRQLVWLNVLYQAATLFTVIANPFLANGVEWFHAWLLVSGALLVGWAVGASGHARLGVSIFLAACLALAVPALVQSVLQFSRGNFSAVYPQWPWSMHKNFLGNLMGVAALVLYARPTWLGWTRRWAVPALAIIVGALAVTQARQALVGLAVGLLVVSLRQHAERRRAVVALLVAVPMIYVVLTMVRDQIASGNQHNSWFTRLEWYADAYDLWLDKPLLGHGLRYWTQPQAPGAFQPPNAFLEVLASAGLVGLVGFVIFWVGTIVVLSRLRPSFGTLALALAVSRLAQAQFDLFWVSVSVSTTFVLIGVCLGLAYSSRHLPDRAPRPKLAAAQ